MFLALIDRLLCKYALSKIRCIVPSSPNLGGPAFGRYRKPFFVFWIFGCSEHWSRNFDCELRANNHCFVFFHRKIWDTAGQERFQYVKTKFSYFLSCGGKVAFSALWYLALKSNRSDCV